MATLVELVARGDLIKLDPQLDWNEFEDRHIYLLPCLAARLQQFLDGAGASWKIEEAPEEQFDALVWEFCSGKPLAIGNRFESIRPSINGIWELKTADLRVFGWFPKRDHFIASHCDLAGRIKEFNLYLGYRAEAVRFRDALDLDVPEFIAGEDVRDVVSDCYYP